MNSTNAQPARDAPTAAAPAATATTSPETSALDELLAAVQAEPDRFDFFALLRRIDALRPDAPRTGEAQRPRQEALRLGQAPELDFAPAALHALEPRPEGPPRLLVRFFGLLGPQGPMPLHFTEVVRDRQRHHDDATLAHFLDVFHHRLLSLFYRAWAQAQPVVHLDRPASDRFRVWLAAMAGTPAGSGRVPAAAMAYYAGWFTGRSRPPEMLCKVLRSYFGVGAEVEEHVGHWLSVDLADQSRLGYARNRAEHAAVPAAALGRTANAGSRVWDRQNRFRLHLGPLDGGQFLAFLPGGSDWPALLHWVRLAAGRELQWDLQLDLAPAHRPAPRLGRHVRLGLTSWLTRHPPATGGAPTETPRRQTAVGLRLRPQTSFLLTRPGGLDA
jgi:type VI secretion system protein ImpH